MHYKSVQLTTSVPGFEAGVLKLAWKLLYETHGGVFASLLAGTLHSRGRQSLSLHSSCGTEAVCDNM